MKLYEARNNLMRVLWMENPEVAPAYLFEEVATAINWALQTMWLSPMDHFRKEESTVTILDGTNFTILPETVQEVLGPVWIPAESDREVSRIEDQLEFNKVFERYYGKTEAEVVADGMAESSYYFIRTRKSVTDDGTEIAIMVKPAATANIELKVMVANEAPSVTTGEITALTIGSDDLVPSPHQYAESIFLPLARLAITRSHFFWEKDKLPMIQQDAVSALSALGVSNPAMGTNSELAAKFKSSAVKQSATRP